MKRLKRSLPCSEVQQNSWTRSWCVAQDAFPLKKYETQGERQGKDLYHDGVHVGMEATKSGKSAWGFDLLTAHENGARAVEGEDDGSGERVRRGAWSGGVEAQVHERDACGGLGRCREVIPDLSMELQTSIRPPAHRRSRAAQAPTRHRSRTARAPPA
jgi:hypothetical protein